MAKVKGYIATLALVSARMGREDASYARDVCWQGVLQWRWRWYRYDKSVNKANARGQWHRTSIGKARGMQ